MLKIYSTCPICGTWSSNTVEYLRYTAEDEVTEKDGKRLFRTYALVGCVHCRRPFIVYFYVPEGEHGEYLEALREPAPKEVFVQAEVVETIPPSPALPVQVTLPDKVRMLLNDIVKMRRAKVSPSLIVATVRSVLEGVLKDKGLWRADHALWQEQSTAYWGIQRALELGLLTRHVADWAQMVQRWENKGIYELEATEEEAEQALRFLQMFLFMMYVVPAMAEGRLGSFLL